MMSESSAPKKPALFVEELFGILRQESFRDPMFDAIRAGRMSRKGVIIWALQAMFVVRDFTRFISAMHANCPDRAAQALLAENLWEEHGKGHVDRDHYSLVKKMARSLGASDDDISNATPLPETTQYINYCLQVTHSGSFVEGMTAVGVGIEYFMPVFFGVLAEKLCQNYGLTKDDVEFLFVHIGEDEDHSRRAIELIERYADTAEVRAKAKEALRKSLRVKRNFSEAVYQQALLAE